MRIEISNGSFVTENNIQIGDTIYSNLPVGKYNAPTVENMYKTSDEVVSNIYLDQNGELVVEKETIYFDAVGVL